jgi:hypothetical protein
MLCLLTSAGLGQGRRGDPGFVERVVRGAVPRSKPVPVRP